MLLSTAEDLAKFVEELKRETDRGLPLVAAALIDDRLAETLRSFFCKVPSASKLLDEGNSPLGSFSSRTEACYALGLIDEFEYNEIGLIRKVRNEFAHEKHGTSFASPRIQGLCSTLRSDLPKEAGYPLQDPRFRFTNAVVVLALRLYHRPDWVALECRSPKTWVDVNATKWRSVEDGLPPPGMPVMVMAKPKS
ncbi:MAG: transcriptional regulator [Ramlibacter sp.]|jgi:mannitol operon repressor|nr:transcriptional regulator [Ramlibacter sp.]